MILNLGLAFGSTFLKVDLGFGSTFLKVDLGFAPLFLKVDFLKVGNKGHKFVFVIYSDFTIIHHLGQAGVDRVSIHHQKGK
jgi:hypothetical protein